MSDERKHTSTKLRDAAAEAIAGSDKPLTVRDIQNWLRDNSPDLYEEVSQKSYDYVRIIMAVSPPDMIVQYKSTEVFPGVDERSAFYGLPGREYDSEIWSPVVRTKKQRSTKPRSSAIKVRTRRLGREAHRRCDAVIEHIYGERVTDSQCCHAWANCTTTIPPQDILWPIFIAAVKKVKVRSRRGDDPQELIRKIMRKHIEFTSETIMVDVITILIWEGLGARDAKFYEVGEEECF